MNPKTGMSVAAVLLFIGMLSVVPAAADTATYTLSLGDVSLCGSGSGPSNCGNGTVKPPYATVTLTLSGGAIYVTETMIGSYHLWEGSANSVMFGFNTSQAVTISNISGSGSGTWSSTTSKSTGSNEFGTFSYAITNNATGDKGTTLSFKVTTTGGFTSVTQLVNPDAAGYTFVAQLKDACENKIGFAGASPQSVVPEPASIALLGSGLCALGGWIRKRRNKL